MITISDVFKSFTESQREAIYELIGKIALDGNYDHDLYNRTQYGMSENQKDVMDFLLNYPWMHSKIGRLSNEKC